MTNFLCLLDILSAFRPMILNIVSLMNTTEMEVDQFDTIEDVKDRICDHLTCDKNCFLIYKNIILKNNNRIGFYKICSNDEIWCGRIESYMESDDIILDVFLTVWPWGELIHLIVKEGDSIDNVRSILGAILSDCYRLVDIWDAHGETVESTQLINEIATCKGGRKIICKLDDGEIDLTFAEYCDMYDRHVANEFWWIHWKDRGKWAEDMRGQMEYIKEIVLSITASDETFNHVYGVMKRCLRQSLFLCCTSIANCIWHILHNNYVLHEKVDNKDNNIPFGEYEQYFYVTLSIAVLDIITQGDHKCLAYIVREAAQYLTYYLKNPSNYWRYLLRLFCTQFWCKDHSDEEIDSMIDNDMQYLFVQIKGSSDVVVPISSQIKTVLHFKKAISMEIGAALKKLYFIDKRSTARPGDNDEIDVNNLQKYSCQIIMSMEDIKILRNIGQGSFGKTVLCQNEKSQDVFIMKIPLGRNSLEKEFIIHSIISDSSKMCGLRGLFSIEGTNCIGMDYKSEGTLGDFIKEHKHLEENQIANICHQILLQIKEMHLCGLIHGDIKPDNIVLDKDLKCFLIDFGFSNDIKSMMANKAYMIGSYPRIADYMAPELLNGETVTETIDTWSLGVLTLEMLNGKRPYHDLPQFEVYSKISKDKKIDFKLKKCTSVKLQKFINSCLEPNPKKRATIDELIQSDFITEFINKK